MIGIKKMSEDKAKRKRQSIIEEDLSSESENVEIEHTDDESDKENQSLYFHERIQRKRRAAVTGGKLEDYCGARRHLDFQEGLMELDRKVLEACATEETKLESMPREVDYYEKVTKPAEEIKWLHNAHQPIPAAAQMIDWAVLGSKTANVSTEVLFSSSIIVAKLLDARQLVASLDSDAVKSAIARSNPYEKISNAGFVSRGAVKMASINAACDFMFTSQKTHDYELLYFADLCGGPGGFSEYVLSRRKWHAKGFGFTLKHKNDFALDKFQAGPCESLHLFYGPMGNGDICSPENQEDFKDLIMKHTFGKGVDIVMSDGGLSEDEEFSQSIVPKELYVCQCLIALMVLTSGGHLVMKLYDLFDSFSVGIVYLMYRCFENVCIFKPNCSKSVTNERYLICKSKKPNCESVIEHLLSINEVFLEEDNGVDSDIEVIEVVPLEVLMLDDAFMAYIRNSNNALSERETKALSKIALYYENPTLVDPTQDDMLQNWPNQWEISEYMRDNASNLVVSPEEKIKEILDSYWESVVNSAPTRLTAMNIMDNVLNKSYDWFCMPCSTGRSINDEKAATLYLSLGRNRVFRYVAGNWKLFGDDPKLELPADTFIYAEFVYEFKWEGSSFSRSPALHILDAYLLGGEDVSEKYITARHRLITKFCDALWKPSRVNMSKYVRVRAKEMIAFGPGIERRLRVSKRRVKTVANTYRFAKRPMERDGENDRESVYMPFNSVIFLRSIFPPWNRYISNTYGLFYICNLRAGFSKRENSRPYEAEANFVQTFQHRVMWHWPYGSKLNMRLMTNIIEKRTTRQIP